jgi:deazaflavin-dependent oxidoreductase (nitroreductase family)
MANPEVTTFEDALIEDMRAHDGKVTSGPLAGHPLLIMTSTGARTGQSRRAILTFSRDGDAYVVAGTSGGAPIDPAWLHNVESNADVQVEIGKSVFGATATIADAEDRDRLWERHVATLPWFADYPAQTGRVIPMVRLRPVAKR